MLRIRSYLIRPQLNSGVRQHSTYVSGGRRMFEGGGMAEYLGVVVLIILSGLIPVVLAIWVVVTLVRMRQAVERIASAVERLVDGGRRVP